ncbi:hypothetical protein C9374_004498 [Naegleria lovaniensis]|uniref:DUF676 domain-containing protein n=1 Tax=Naegleria lovaniensis TaxID=51637 RepID=A0AA88GLF8_NAELO|nr:uncharacterized protein C9374_004498 [Naegleria lovaniensis]KAG2383161.1 hypothetical protein C9374_004498 [Naegleria lovaniensis]
MTLSKLSPCRSLLSIKVNEISFRNRHLQYNTTPHRTHQTLKNIVLVHGCFGFASQFCLLEKKLLEHGSRHGLNFKILNYCYPSPRQSIERSSEELLQFLNENQDMTGSKHVLSSVGNLWNRNVFTNNNNIERLPNIDTVNPLKQEYHFVTHSMGSMVVRRLLVTLMSQLETSKNQSNPVLDILHQQEMLNLIQVSPLLSGNVRLARNLSFLLPLAKILRKYEHEPTIVEQLMMNELSDDTEFTERYWWPSHSPLFGKVQLTHVVTSLSTLKDLPVSSHTSHILSDLVLTYEEQTSRVPSHMKIESVLFKADHNSVLLRRQCIDKILEILSKPQ